MENVSLTQDTAVAINIFLKNELEECNKVISSKKRKILITKTIHYIFVTISTICSVLSGLLAAFYNPNIIVGSLSAVVTLCIVLSVSFNISGRMKNLGENIQKLYAIKKRLAYITTSGNRITDQERNVLINEFSELSH